MHIPKEKHDKEVMAFIASCMSYGRRELFFPKIQYILDCSKTKLVQWILSGNDLREARKVYKIKKSVHLITQMNALIKKRRLPTLPHCIAVPSTPGLRGSNLHKKL